MLLLPLLMVLQVHVTTSYSCFKVDESLLLALPVYGETAASALSCAAAALLLLIMMSAPLLPGYVLSAISPPCSKAHTLSAASSSPPQT
jgi:hypothetical protein